MRFDVIGDASSAARAFRQTAEGAALAARGAKQLSESLTLQSKSAQVSAAATLALAKSDDILRDAELELSGAAEEARRQLAQQGRAADDAAVKTRLAGSAASGAGSGFAGLGGPMAAVVAAGAALAPVIVTVGTGMAGLALAAKSAVGPVLQAGTATAQARDALKGLDPAQRAAYQSLAALKGQFAGFSRALQPEVLSIFDKGLGLASGLLGDIEPVAAATGKALAGVVGEIGADLKTQQWREFFVFMANQAGPDIKLLGNLFVDLLNDIPPLIEGLQPLATGLLEIGDIAAKTIGPIVKAVSIFTSPTGSATAFAKAQESASGAAGDFAKLAAQAQKAADQVKRAGAGTAQAAPQVGTLAGDMALLNTAATNASTALSAYDDAWKKIVGNSLSDQQAVLADESAFKSLTDAVKNNGAGSLQARQAFVSYIQQVGSSIQTLQQNGASVGQVNKEYETNIRRLQGLHSLTPQQRADVQGLVKDYDTWASSTAGLNKQALTAAGTIKNDFTANLKSLGEFTPKIGADVDRLSNSILKTGTTSGATRGERAALIADLRQSGIGADSARKLVDGLERQIGQLHGKNVDIGAATGGARKAVQSFQQMVDSLHGKTVTVGAQVIGSSSLAQAFRRGFAAGTPGAASGWAWVGERGPELVNFRGGEQVLPHPVSVAAARGYAGGTVPQVIPGGRGGTGGPVTIVIENHGVIGSQAETDNWLSNGIDRLAKQGRLAYALRRSQSAA